MISPAPNTCRLNIQPLGQFPPTPRLSVSPIHIAQQCGPLATHRGFRQHRSHIPYLRTTQRPQSLVLNLQRDNWLPLLGRERVV